MLAIFSSLIVKSPEELIHAGDRSPTPKKSVMKLVDGFNERFPTSVNINIGSSVQILYSHDEQKLFQTRSFAAKDEIFCLFEGTLENLWSLKQYYGIAKKANEVVFVMEAYKALRDQALYPTSHMLRHLNGNFAFVVFDKSTSTVFVALDQEGKVAMYMGITADGYLAFSDDADILRAACGKSLAMFPSGCFFSTSAGMASYEHPKKKVTAVPAIEEETWGATFKIEGHNQEAFV